MTQSDADAAAQGQLFRDADENGSGDVERLGEGAVLLRRFVGADAERVLSEINSITETAPFRHMTTPNGAEMSVAMTNCGELGWVSDRQGYRYDAIDPLSGQHWPPMAPSLLQLAVRAAEAGDFRAFQPDACLINRYQPGARLSLHQDRDELDFTAPIVSVSLGLPAMFLWGGLKRTERPRRIRLESGDVVVWGGPARLVFHGVAPLAKGSHPLTGPFRINLTFRKAR
jgi:alkylated DNA repair protein (DNA oxidative demethylase)